MQKLRNIIVTGSNKGIGYGIVQNLAQKNCWNIIMACRNVELANKSRDELLSRFKDAHIHVEQLDVSDNKSIHNFVQTVADKYKTIDVLINNAGVSNKKNEISEQVATWTFATNFYGTIYFTDAILNYVRNSGKVIFVGSRVGKLNQLSQRLKNQFRNPNLSKTRLYELMNEFIQAVREGNYAEKGWARSCYRVSKIGINQYARVFAKEKNVVERKIQAYAMCPGWVNTDMTSYKAELTIQQGALTPVFLAELPFEVNPQYQGKFFERSALSSLE